MADGLPPGLHIVATPIGNLGDLSPRAADTLRRADLILAEDTRVTAKLLNHIGHKVPMRRFDDHSSEAEREQILALLADQAIALVSDAGTPLISDPGYKLVRAARAAGLAVHTVPGPSAVIAALTLAGLPTDRFLFLGFLAREDRCARPGDRALRHGRRDAGPLRKRTKTRRFPRGSVADSRQSRCRRRPRNQQTARGVRDRHFGRARGALFRRSAEG